MNSKQILLSVLAVFLFAAAANAAQVVWGAFESNGVGVVDNNGTPLPVGDLALIGHFNLTPAQVVANGANEAFLMANFVQYSSAFIGAGDPNPPNNAGYWEQTSFASTNALGLQNQAIDYWVFNASTISGATQYGIFTGSASSNLPIAAAWQFPSDTAIPNSTVTDLSDVPHDSTGILWGSYNGTGVSGDGISPLYYLAPFSAVPEPATWFGALLLGGAIGVRTWRRHRAT